MKPRIAVLVSGRGSNLMAIHAANLPLDIAAVVSNRPHAAGLDWARQQGLPTVALDHTLFASREAFDATLADTLARVAPDLVVLAGYMRILTPGFVARFAGRLINIHPSLLPAFPGLATHARALAAGVKLHGATVHFVTAELDHGPIVIQGAVPVRPDDTADTLAARVLAVEHRIYPQALRWFAEGRLAVENGVVNVRGEAASQWVFLEDAPCPKA